MKKLPVILLCWVVSAAEPAFDVVSIHLPAPQGQGDVQDPNFGDILGATYRFEDRVRFRATTLLILLQQAYDVKYFQIVGGPAWIGTERFDISATYAVSPSPEDFRAMIRTLLADRFGLKLHHETRTFDAYRLIPAKGGPKLGQSVPAGRGLYGTPVTGGYKFVSQGDTLDHLASGIELEFRIRGQGIPVVNQTGIEGAFNFETTFARDLAGPVPSPYPTLFNALEYDLGLQLEKSKVPLDSVVIDHVDRRPTEN